MDKKRLKKSNIESTIESVTESVTAAQPLLFNEKLESNSITKPIPVTDLIYRLQDLHAELKHIENTGITPHQTVSAVCLSLVSRSLLQHKDRGVRILVACCLAELLRLHAPTVPISTAQLKSVFALFFQQLPNITDSKYTYFSLCYELLECLNSAKTVTLVSELNADELVITFFNTLFKSVRPEMSQSVIACLLDLLQQLIDDSEFLHHDVIDTLLFQLSSAQKTASPTAYQMACELCQASADKLQRYVCQYFSDILIAAGKDISDDSNSEQFISTHRLILEIYKSAPDILLNVIPQLEEELKVDTLPLRTLALTSLGEMFLQSGSNLISIYPQVWKAWCDRRNDKAVSIRTGWLKYAVWIVCKHRSTFTELESYLQHKLLDPDERVRIETVKAFESIWTELPMLIHQESLKALTLRCRDKKANVRCEAIDTVARLFNHLMSVYSQCELANVDKPIELTRFIWLAGDILDLLYVCESEISILVEKALWTYIIPPLSDSTAYTKRILKVLHTLTPKQYKAFQNLLIRKSNSVYQLTIYLMQCEKYNGGIMDTDEKEITNGLNMLVAHLGQTFPDIKRATAGLMKFADVNDRRVYQLIQTVMNPQSEYKKIVGAQKEVMKRITQHGGALFEVFEVLVRRVSLIGVGRSCVECLMRICQEIRHGHHEDIREMEPTAKQFMKDISVHFPGVYKNLVQSFIETIVNEADTSSVRDALLALTRYIKTFPGEAPSQPKLTIKLKQMALGDDLIMAKSAMIVLALGGQDDQCVDIVNTILPELTLDNPVLVTKLACLQAAARYAYQSSFLSNVVPIMNFIIKKVILVNQTEASEQVLDWVDYDDLAPEGKIKIMSLKLAVKPLLNLNDEQEDASKMDLAKSVLKMLRMILDNSGEAVTKGYPTSLTYKTHLRLTAGLCMLKLARNKQIRTLFDPMDTRRMSLLVQDPVYNVRSTFVIKLCTYIQNTQVPSEYIVMLFFIAHEPDAMLMHQVRSFITRRAKSVRVCDDTSQAPLVENTFGSFLHLASHHPDFSTLHDDLESSEGYVRFFFDTVATAENIALLYSIATKIKTLKDKHATDSQGLYVVSEMAQILIHDRASSNSWTLQSWQGRLPISSRLFEHLSSADASANIKRQFLGQSYLKERTQRSRTPVKRTAVSDTPSRTRESHSSPLSTPLRRQDVKRRKNTNGVNEYDDDTDNDSSKKKKRKPTDSAYKKRSPLNLKSKNNESTPLRRSGRKSTSHSVSLVDLSDSEALTDEDEMKSDHRRNSVDFEQENVLGRHTPIGMTKLSKPASEKSSLYESASSNSQPGTQLNVLERMMAVAASKTTGQRDGIKTNGNEQGLAHDADQDFAVPIKRSARINARR
ncbi:Sister chromatid cohesion protein pds5 [Batrachochytrium dendrobatidis]